MEKYDWVCDPISCDVMASGLSGKAEDKLLVLSSDCTLRMRFSCVQQNSGHVNIAAFPNNMSL